MGRELLVWYGNDYEQHWGIPTGLLTSKSDTEASEMTESAGNSAALISSKYFGLHAFISFILLRFCALKCCVF